MRCRRMRSCSPDTPRQWLRRPGARTLGLRSDAFLAGASAATAHEGCPGRADSGGRAGRCGQAPCRQWRSGPGQCGQERCGRGRCGRGGLNQSLRRGRLPRPDRRWNSGAGAAIAVRAAAARTFTSGATDARPERPAQCRTRRLRRRRRTAGGGGDPGGTVRGSDHRLQSNSSTPFPGRAGAGASSGTAWTRRCRARPSPGQNSTRRADVPPRLCPRQAMPSRRR